MRNGSRINIENFFSSIEIADMYDDIAMKKCEDEFQKGATPLDIDSESDTIIEPCDLMPYVLENFREEIYKKTKIELMVFKIIKEYPRKYFEKKFNSYHLESCKLNLGNDFKRAREILQTEIIGELIVNGLPVSNSRIGLDLKTFIQEYKPSLQEKLRQHYSI